MASHDYLYRVKFHTADAVHAPGKRSDWFTSLLVPNVHLLAARGKFILAPVVGHRVERGLKMNWFKWNHKNLMNIYTKSIKGKAKDKCPKQNWLQNELSLVIILYFIDKTLWTRICALSL